MGLESVHMGLESARERTGVQVDGLYALLQVRNQDVGMAQLLRRCCWCSVLRCRAALGAAHRPAGQLRGQQAARVRDRSWHDRKRCHHLKSMCCLLWRPLLMFTQVGE